MGLPEEDVEVGFIRISLGLTPRGTQSVAFDIDGLDDEAAIGYLVTITDRVRDRVRDSWEAVQFYEDDDFDGDDEEPDDDEV